jgi:signal transduction histidine kinase
MPNLARPRQPSHRARIVTLVLGTGLPVLLLAIFGLWRYLEISKQQVVDERTVVAEAGAQTTQAFASDIVSSAETLALSPEVTNPSRRAALPGLLQRMQQANPKWDQVAVLDASGGDLASTGSLEPNAHEVRILTSRVVQTGSPAVAIVHVSPATAMRVLIGVPLRFADGTRGVLLVSPSLRTLTAELQGVARGPHVTTEIADGNGVALVGPPDASGWLSNQEIHDAVASGNAGARQASGEGEAMLVAYAPVQQFGWVVVIGQPTAYAFGAFEQQVRVAGVAMMLALGLAGLAAWILGGKLSLYYRRIIEARDLAEHATQTRDAVLASVSHDLRNPLAAAKGYLQLLQRHLELDPEAPARTLSAGLTRTQHAVNRMQVMTDELVDAARLRSGYELVLRPGLADMLAVVVQVVDEQLATAGGHRIRVDCESSDLWVICDSGRISRVIANLLSNAVKYSPADSQILVELQRETDAACEWVVVSISDEGIGIPAEDLPCLFDRFHRGRNVSTQVGGTGLGLAGVRTIVEQHGGRVDVESEEGAGTTVQFRLPRGTVKRRPTEADTTSAETPLALAS